MPNSAFDKEGIIAVLKHFTREFDFSTFGVILYGESSGDVNCSGIIGVAVEDGDAIVELDKRDEDHAGNVSSCGLKNVTSSELTTKYTDSLT